ncbi:MAG: shikimate kinase [Actinobacteria bacterium]|nr:shikimate kinase [Actinomycetota bacterium]
MAARVILIGAPGSGKSAVGAELAASLGCTHLDTDHLVETSAGMSVADVFTSGGEADFRQMEAAACLAAFSTDGAVVSVGGGAVMTASVREACAGIPVAWLDATLTEIAERVRLDVPRPLLLGNIRRQLMDMLALRVPVYTDLATITVQTAGKSPAAIARDIATALGESEQNS